MSNWRECSNAPRMEEAPSVATKHKVAAAKQYTPKVFQETNENLQEQRQAVRSLCFILFRSSQVCFTSQVCNILWLVLI